MAAKSFIVLAPDICLMQQTFFSRKLQIRHNKLACFALVNIFNQLSYLEVSLKVCWLVVIAQWLNSQLNI